MTNAAKVQGYHFLQADMSSGARPTQRWKIGQRRYLRKGEPIVPCQYGFHASPTVYDAIQYAPGPVLCLVTLSGDITPHGDPMDKWAARSRKLLVAVNVERQLREFACDCAERLLPLWEKMDPDNQRPRQTIEVARRYARGGATAEELEAASDAAWAAASDAEREWQRHRAEEIFTPLVREAMKARKATP